MADPSPRQAILAEFLARVATIRVANGFHTDAGAAIFLGETPELGPDDPDAAIALLVRDDVLSDQGDVVLTVLPVEAQAIAKADLDEPWATVEAVVADIKAAIEAGGSRSFGGLLTRDLLRGRTRVLPRDAGSTDIGAGVEYRATYLDEWGATA